MTTEQAKSELMQIYMSLSEEKKKALDVALKAMEQAQADTIPREAVKDVSYDGGDNWWVKNMREQIKAQADGEYISRKALLEDLYKRDYTKFTHRDFVALVQYQDIVAIPPAEPKTGHWIGIDEEPHEVWECDHCGFVIDGSGCIDPYDYRDTYKFCPNCGCRMFEPQEISERNLKMWHDIFEEEKRREGSDKA